MNLSKIPGGRRGMSKSIRSVVWTIGMAYLIFTGNWWPGILYLAGISMLVEVVLKLIFAATVSGESYEDEEFSAPMPDKEMGDGGLTTAPMPSSDNDRMQRLDPDPIPPVNNLPREYRTDLLPSNCPNCGAPIGPAEVEMVGIKTAKCSFCGSNFSVSE